MIVFNFAFNPRDLYYMGVLNNNNNNINFVQRRQVVTLEMLAVVGQCGLIEC